MTGSRKLLCNDPQVLKLMNKWEKKFDKSNFRYSRLTLLHKAVISNDAEMVKILLEHGADVSVKCPLRGSYRTTPLEYVNVKSRVDLDQKLKIVKLIVDQGVPLNAFSYSNVLRYGNKEVVRAVLQSNIDLFARDKFGHTPVHYLVMNRNHGVIDELHGRKFDVNARNRREQSLLYHCLSYSKLPSTVEFLLRNGADPNAQDVMGRTPLYATATLAISRKSKDKKLYRDVAELLLTHGADPQLQFLEVFEFFFSLTLHHYSHVLEPFLSHFALMEKRGTTIDNKILRIILSNAKTRDYFSTCRQQLNTLETINIDDSLSLYQLLISSDSKMEQCVRDSNILSKIRSICGNENAYRPYGFRIRKRYIQAIAMINLRNKASIAISNLTRLNYNPDGLIVHKIIGYLDCIDLKRLCEL